VTVAAKWLRRLEIALIIAGISFIGGALASTARRWQYQTSEEQGLLRRGEVAAAALTSAGTAAPVPGNQATLLPGQDRAVVPRQADGPGIQTGSVARPRRARASGRPTLGLIEIPRIGIRAVVSEGTDEATLALAVGHLPGTPQPGQNGNAVLAGHRDTFFRELRNIRMSDRVRFIIPPRSYDYRVVSLDVVAPDETRVLEPGADEELTLVTCYPFNFIGEAPSRFVVKAVRVEEHRDH
jgi:sortase A